MILTIDRTRFGAAYSGMTEFRIFVVVALVSVFGAVVGKSQDNQVVNRTYRIGSDFLGSAAGGGGSAGSSDPFSAEPPAESGNERVRDIQQIVGEDLGIEFPEGTWMRHDPRTGRLEIQHLPGVVKAIEAYFKALNPAEKSINVRAEIYQLPAKVALKLQQFCGPLDDHSAAVKSLATMVERGEATLVVTAPVLARSGQRAKVQQIEEVIYQTELDWDSDNQTVIPAAFETRNVGTELEVDPVLGPDDFTIDLNFSLEHHSAPPTMRPITVTSPKSGQKVVTEFPAFHSKKVITQVTMADGTIKLVGAWRPTGKPEFEKEDLMQIAFLRADVIFKQVMVPLPGNAGSK